MEILILKISWRTKLKELYLKQNKMDNKNTKQEIILARGAEAIISLKQGNISKSRIKKSYRISEIDERLRKSRTKSEGKIIEKLANIILVPKIIKTDLENKEILMEHINGLKLSENLENLDYKKISKQIGEIISKLHDCDIIHGDLTTSNMIYVEDKIDNNINSNDLQTNNTKNQSTNKKSKRVININNKIENPNFKVYLIDFGLGFHSRKIEDKAVDLHLLSQALNAKHYKIADECIKIILDNYKAKDFEQIIKRIKVIESRGRYKDKY
jgi:bifunctional N6-L-threonylcarbamoyladenine synthase / protein kinase Bud32